MRSSGGFRHFRVIEPPTGPAIPKAYGRSLVEEVPLELSVVEIPDELAVRRTKRHATPRETILLDNITSSWFDPDDGYMVGTTDRGESARLEWKNGEVILTVYTPAFMAASLP